MTEILYNNRTNTINITENITQLLDKVVNACLEVEEFNLESEISISFVDNEEIRNLNRDFRNKDIATDVLSFPLLDEEDNNILPLILGDIIISIPKVIEQSEEFEHSFERELCYLTAHGMFHLLGYNHILEEDKIIMRQKEESVMKILNISR